MDTRFAVLSTEALAAEVARILSKQLGSNITAATDLIATGMLDSVGVVRLLSEIEHRLRVSVPVSDLDIDDLRSATAVARTIDRVLAARTQNSGKADGVVELRLPEAVSKP